MELAATENANVCASVRIRYFAVESTSPEERLRGRVGLETGGAGRETVGMGGIGTGSIILAEGCAQPEIVRKPKGLNLLREYRLIGVRLLDHR